MAESLQFTQIYRSREVDQSYITSVWTTLIAIAHGLWLMIRIRPEVVLFFLWSIPISSFYGLWLMTRIRPLFMFQQGVKMWWKIYIFFFKKIRRAWLVIGSYVPERSHTCMTWEAWLRTTKTWRPRATERSFSGKTFDDRRFAVDD